MSGDVLQALVFRSGSVLVLVLGYRESLSIVAGSTQYLPHGIARGKRLVARKLDRKEQPKGFSSSRLKETPAVVIYGSSGTTKKTFQGKISARKLAAAMRSVAGDKSPPK